MPAFIEINTVSNGLFTIRLNRIECILQSANFIHSESEIHACDIVLTNGEIITVTEEYQEFLDRLAQIAPWISIVE
jgi:hypothetical protein